MVSHLITSHIGSNSSLVPDPNKDYPLSAAKIGGYTDGGQLAHPVCLEWREREREGERERERERERCVWKMHVAV